MSYEQDFFSQRILKDLTVKVPLEMQAAGNGYEVISEDNVKDAINYDLKSILLTSKGERFDKNFGVGLRQYLFEQQGSPKLGSLRREIDRQISIYMPWLSQYDVNVRIDIDKHMSHVEIKYKINDINIVGYFNISVELSSL